jgi:hypothetical protein
MRKRNEHVEKIEHQVTELQLALNDQILSFVEETGIPIMVAVTKPEQTGLGGISIQQIKINAVI